MSMRKTSNRYSASRRAFRDNGQVTIFVVIAMAVFLLGFVGFAVDMTNLWFHRQMAQGAADAACQAGIMNVLVKTTSQGFTAGTDFNCSTTPAATPCRYANLNGYNGSGLVVNAPSNSVAVTFPCRTCMAGSGVPDPPPAGLAPNPFLTVDVIDRVKLTFASLITLQPTSDVRARASCGLVLAKAPIPIIVLNPTCTHPFEVSSSATLKVVGGPIRSVQVNSANLTCAAATAPSGCSGAGTIDLSEGGPSFTGSMFGVFGAPSTAPGNFLPGSTGSWVNTAPISDPYASTPPPSVPGPALPPTPDPSISPAYSCAAVPCNVPYLAWGCPDTIGCAQYTPGLYTSPIVVKNKTAIFDPGIYYMQVPSAALDAVNCGSPGNGCTAKPTGQCYSDFTVDSNGIVRPSTALGDGSMGTMFYLSGDGSGARPYGGAFFGANAGKPGGRTVGAYNTANVNCPGGTPPDPRVGMPATMNGNVLLGPCTTGGNYVPFDAGPPDPAAIVRGILFFQDRDNGYQNGQSSMQGGGGLLLSGSLYYHHCASTDGAGLGTSCQDPAAGYQSFFQLQGTPGSGTFVLGNITSDQLVESGNGAVAMQLDPNRVYFILKATLMR